GQGPGERGRARRQGTGGLDGRPPPPAAAGTRRRRRSGRPGRGPVRRPPGGRAGSGPGRPRPGARAIAELSGGLLRKSPQEVVVDVAGVGYRVFIPLSSFYRLGEAGDATRLRIHTHVREDALALYGFLTAEEQDLYERLIDVSGVGPKLALNILSG